MFKLDRLMQKLSNSVKIQSSEFKYNFEGRKDGSSEFDLTIELNNNTKGFGLISSAMDSFFKGKADTVDTDNLKENERAKLLFWMEKYMQPMIDSVKKEIAPDGVYILSCRMEKIRAEYVNHKVRKVKAIFSGMYSGGD